MKKSWLRIMLVGLCVGAVLLPLVSTASATTPHNKPACAHKKAGTHKKPACAHKKTSPHKKVAAKPHKKAAAKPHKKAAPKPLKKATVGAGGVSLDSWMGDLAPRLRSRKLGEIVIPGSHDSTTYSLDEPGGFVPFAQTQDEDLTAQLNAGIRQFDIRVIATTNQGDYYARHGSGLLLTTSSYLTLSNILTSIQQWALVPGHEHEIILLNLNIDQNQADTDAPFPTQDCRSFGAALGSALLTPSQLGTGDPSQVTLGQLWSLPDPKGAARVIMNNDQCMDAADPYAGQWSTWGSGYYADQCTANGDPNVGTLGNQSRGTDGLDLGAAQLRATEAGAEPSGWGPAQDGGFWELDIQSTPEADCLYTPSKMQPDEVEVLADLYKQWEYFSATRQNLNVVEADFVEDTDLVADAVAMDQSLPGLPDTVTRLGAERVEVPQGAPSIPTTAFAALASYQGAGTAGAAVTYQISPATPGVGFGYDHRYTSLTVAADEQGDVNPGDLWFPDLSGRTGTWTVTAAAAGAPTKASWTVVVVPATGLRLRAVPCDEAPCNPPTVGVTNTYTEDQSGSDLSFTVAAIDKSGYAVPGVPVTFDARSAGTFGGGSNSVTLNTRDYLFHNRAAAPAFTAHTRAGTFPISVTSPQADNTLTLPVKITPDHPTSFVVTKGDGQATPINTKFAVALKGHWVDEYGNVVTDPPPADRVLTLSPYDGTWPNGSHSSVTVTPDADGTITAPDLTAGKGVLAGPDAAHSLIVKVGGTSGWTLQVMPGPPAKVTAASGGGQHTAAGQPFAQALATKVIDAGANPIPGYPVTFKVTAGDAAFAPVNLGLAAAFAGNPALLHAADPPRDAVTALTNDQGVATAPALTAGLKGGLIAVTASAGVAPAIVQAVFHLSTDAVAPGAPKITGAINGDGKVGVEFSDASPGSAPITSYEVSATDENRPTTPAVTATGPSSPVTVTGLTSGDPYVFTVTATSPGGTSPASAAYGPLNVGVAPVIQSGPANGVAGQPYSSGFTVTGAPAPTLTKASGDLPPGLRLASDGGLTGTPTQAGSYMFTVQAANPVGIYDASVTVAITSITRGAAPPVSGERRVHATICTTRAGHKPACAVRALIGTFPPLGASATARLVRGTVTYAAGRASAHYGKLTLTRWRQIPEGSYTLILRRAQYAIIVAVTIR